MKLCRAVLVRRDGLGRAGGAARAQSPLAGLEGEGPTFSKGGWGRRGLPGPRGCSQAVTVLHKPGTLTGS